MYSKNDRRTITERLEAIGQERDRRKASAARRRRLFAIVTTEHRQDVGMYVAGGMR